LLIDSVAPAETAVAPIPVSAPELAALYVIRPPLAFPSWLPSILRAAVTAPLLVIPVNVPVVALFAWFLTILVLIFAVAGAAEFEIAVNAPVPESVPDRTLLVVIVSVPVPPVLTIPDQTPAPEVNEEQF
jgi:hypothetical protein